MEKFRWGKSSAGGKAAILKSDDPPVQSFEQKPQPVSDPGLEILMITRMYCDQLCLLSYLCWCPGEGQQQRTIPQLVVNAQWVL